MIDEKKMIDAFDLLETVFNLSDVYHRKDIEKDVFATFIGCNESLKVRFVDWSDPDNEVTEYKISLTGTRANPELAEIYEFIKKELDLYDN